VRKGDLVEMDTPGQRVHGKIGIVVDLVAREATHVYDWDRDGPKKFVYRVLVEGQVWSCTYENLLEQECLPGDEEG